MPAVQVDRPPNVRMERDLFKKIVCFADIGREVMLIKEYHIPLPLTLEEYKIAQLYMIQVHVHIY